MFTPKTGRPCGCKRGIERDNCPQCEGTGQQVDFAAIHRAKAVRLYDTIETAERWPFDQMAEARHAGRSVWFQVSDEFYEYCLGVLPPIFVPGGFAVGEPHDDDEQGHTIYAFLAQAGGVWFATYTTREQFADRRAGLVAALRLRVSA